VKPVDTRRIERELRVLKLYALGSGAVMLVFLLSAFRQSPEDGQGAQSAKFTEIDVERINVLEPNGQYRMVISNRARSIGPIFRGKPFGYAGGNRPGMIFFNDEGTENGGLTFTGKREANGTFRSTGHLSFDQYEQDQTLQMTYGEEDGKRHAFFMVNDYPDGPSDLDAWDKWKAMPEGAAKTAERKRLMNLYGPRRRAFMGRMGDRSTALSLFDADGRPRITLKVTAEGAASMEFLDENGKTVKTVTPSSKDAG
jgi:hypothetical protein